ncbi:hypothetical protein GCM10010430_78460 [Kitasatospora cystarginea]|uniref:Transposase IS116/IS110/IS902 C-terminal domain-containing protein n=1 Tax=Kitasatospora cystarginea TaxID=58350 RepID=A0ABN3F1I5_9ACTN
MPGIGTRTGARILIDVGDASAFSTVGHLASYAVLAPATRSSGSSIRGEQPSRLPCRFVKQRPFTAGRGLFAAGSTASPSASVRWM